MAKKLLDGNITITDNASKALSNIEKALKQIEKVAKPVTYAMKQLDATVNNMAKSTGSMAMSSKEATKNLMAQKRALAGLEAQSLQNRAKYDATITANRAGLVRMRSDADLRKIAAREAAKINVQNNDVLTKRQIANDKKLAEMAVDAQDHANRMIRIAQQDANDVASHNRRMTEMTARSQIEGKKAYDKRQLQAQKHTDKLDEINSNKNARIRVESIAHADKLQLEATKHANGLAEIAAKEQAKQRLQNQKSQDKLSLQNIKHNDKLSEIQLQGRTKFALDNQRNQFKFAYENLRNNHKLQSMAVNTQNKIVVDNSRVANKQTLLAQQHANKMAQIAAKAQANQNKVNAQLAARQQLINYTQALRQQNAAQKAAQKAANATPFQKKMQAWAANGGTLSPLWQAFGKHPNAIAAFQNPGALTSGLAASLGKMGSFGRGATGFVAGRALGSMFGGAAGGLAGGLAGGAVAAGPVGLAIAAAASGIIWGLQKLIVKVQEIASIMDEMSSERATESTALRRKMQMSSEMFGVDPRNVDEIDRKIYGYRPVEQQYYKRGMPGRDIITSGIEWLHLLGTKDIGGTFVNEQQAFDFSEALSSISKMNGLSEREYETVRYQGMQILSKGYADILDIKPLLNSAPGFVRDLLAQTGMSRSEFLESGRTRGFTSDKFINALMAVKDYYAILSERESSRTMEQQEEAAKNIIGAASVWDEHYKKAKAESNQMVTNAVTQSAIAEDIKKSWYQMWSFANDAQDGINNKVKFEKWMTYQINGAIRDIYTTWLFIKNTFDLFLDGLGFVVGHIGAALMNIWDLTTGALKFALGGILTALGDKLHLDELKEAGEALDPNSKRNREERAKEELSDALVEQIYADQRKGQHYIEAKYSYLKDKFVTDEVVTGKKTFEMERLPTAAELKAGIISPKTTTTETRPWWGYSSAHPMLDTLLYADEKDKRVGRLRDKSEMKKLIQDNYEQFVDAQGKFITATRLADLDSAMSLADAQVSMAGVTVNLADELGLSGRGTDDYTFWNTLGNRHKWVTETMIGGAKNDVEDFKRAAKMNADAKEEARKAYENVKDPYLDKIAKNTDEIKENTGKSSARVLDVLKELAGVTVINKVTKVRPDVVFNYGSYGRSGKLEDPNLIHVGEMNALAETLMSFAKTYDDEGFEQEIRNGSAAVVTQ